MFGFERPAKRRDVRPRVHSAALHVVAPSIGEALSWAIILNGEHERLAQMRRRSELVVAGSADVAAFDEEIEHSPEMRAVNQPFEMAFLQLHVANRERLQPCKEGRVGQLRYRELTL